TKSSRRVVWAGSNRPTTSLPASLASHREHLRQDTSIGHQFDTASALLQNLPDPAGGSCLKTNPTGADNDEAVQQASRHDLARALAPRYTRASSREKRASSCMSSVHSPAWCC